MNPSPGQAALRRRLHRVALTVVAGLVVVPSLALGIFLVTVSPPVHDFRPLGLAFDARQNLVVANHGKGMQSVAPDGTVTLLADRAAGEPIRFANDLVIGSDGSCGSPTRVRVTTRPRSATCRRT